MVNWDELEKDPDRANLYIPDGVAHSWAKTARGVRGDYMSQLRNFLITMESVASKIQDDSDAKFGISILFPKLANAVGRNQSQMPRELYDNMVAELKVINAKSGFLNFVNFFKAVIQFYTYEKKVHTNVNANSGQERSGHSGASYKKY